MGLWERGKRSKVEPLDTKIYLFTMGLWGRGEAGKENQSWEQVRRNTSRHVCERNKEAQIFTHV